MMEVERTHTHFGTCFAIQFLNARPLPHSIARRLPFRTVQPRTSNK